MVNERMHALGAEPSAIRELFAYGLARKAEIGEENVFDYSIGNPSVPSPDAIKQAVIDLMEEPPCALHGYTPAAGDPRVRASSGRPHQAPLRHRRLSRPGVPDGGRRCRLGHFHFCHHPSRRRGHRDRSVLPRIQGVDRNGRMRVRGSAGPCARLPAGRGGHRGGHHAEDQRRHHQLPEQPGGRRVHAREPGGVRRRCFPARSRSLAASCT